jgi:ribosomal-protein-alanine N-acetyltransferase
MNENYKNLIFKEADKSDLTNSDFYSASFFNLDLFKKFKNSKIYLVLEKNEQKIIGFLEISHVLDECDIIHIEITKKYREQGIGSKFVEYALLDLKNKGIQKIFLEVRKSNIPAIKLYEKFNFQKIDIRYNYYSNPIEDAILMVKKYV